MATQNINTPPKLCITLPASYTSDGSITSSDLILSGLDLQRFAYKWSTSFTPLNPPVERGETGNQVPSP